jgi:hypothetical protein
MHKASWDAFFAGAGTRARTWMETMANSRINRPKRLLTRRMQSARTVLYSIDAFAPHLREAQRPFVSYLGHRLTRVRTRLSRTERDLGRREAQRSRDLRRRERARKSLRCQMVHWRGTCEHLFGAVQLEEIGFARRIEEEAEALLEQAITVTDTIDDADFVAAKPRLLGFRVEWPELLAEIKALSDGLRVALDNLRATKCAVTVALHDRNQALAAFNRDFLHISRIIEGLLRRLELDDLADRVRPSTRRPGVTHLESVEEKSISDSDLGPPLSRDEGKDVPPDVDGAISGSSGLSPRTRHRDLNLEFSEDLEHRPQARFQGVRNNSRIEPVLAQRAV